jgi:uncharacterized 2Fe-2S/4Fe-4S cluster protein (DUF4445 family)
MDDALSANTTEFVPLAHTDKPGDALVLFMPSGRRGRFAVGTPVLDAARSLGVYIESVCGGRGICGRCQVTVAEGNFAKHGITSSASNLAAFTDTEERYKRVRTLPADRRLSCSAKVLGDLVIDVPTDTAVNAQIVRKRAETRDIVRDLTTRLYYVEVSEPDMHQPLGDADRLVLEIIKEHGLKNLIIDFPLLPRIQKILRKGEWKVTAIVHDDGKGRPVLIGLLPGYSERLFGIATDIGSTTIAMHLSDMMTGRTIASAGTSNPQIRFGEDLMSRVSYVMMNPGGEVALTTTVREAINTLVTRVCGQAGVAPDEIVEAVFVGNPIMHHLFLGIDPTELGGAPFALAVSGGLTFPARDIGLTLHPGARVYTLPCIAGHVGADAAGVTLAEAPHRSDEIALLVDIGTNAEIVLGSSKRLVAASSPTGPAFEGAQITAGQRAAPGAIERVRIDPATLEPKIRVIGVEAWSDEAEFAEKIDQVGVTGICGSGIIEVVAEMYLAGIISEDGVIRGELAGKSDRIISEGRTFSYVLWRPEDLVANPALATGDNGQVAMAQATHIVTQNDIRAIQLAKAALYAGIKLLMDKLAIDHVDRVKLAGAFGSFIDPKYAMVLGLIPDCDLSKVAAVGNAAGTGARMVLLNRGHRMEIEELVGRIEKIETALEPKFQEHFVYAMALPNKVDAFPHLEREVKLPERGSSDASAANTEGRRGRRGGRGRAE